MKSNLNKEILEAINKDLPNQLGSVLKEKLNENETLMSENKNLIKELDGLNKALKEYEALGRKEESLDKRELILNQKEEELKELKRNIEIEKLTYQLNNEKDKVQFTKDVALGLVRNSEFRKTINNNRSEYDPSTGFTNNTSDIIEENTQIQ
jgi:hypothetical protein